MCSEESSGCPCLRSLPVCLVILNPQLLNRLILILLHESDAVLLGLNGGRLTILDQRVRRCRLLIFGHRRSISGANRSYSSKSWLLRSEQSPTLCRLAEESSGRGLTGACLAKKRSLRRGLSETSKSGRFGRSECRIVVVSAEQGRTRGRIILRSEQRSGLLLRLAECSESRLGSCRSAESRCRRGTRPEQSTCGGLRLSEERRRRLLAKSGRSPEGPSRRRLPKGTRLPEWTGRGCGASECAAKSPGSTRLAESSLLGAKHG